MNAQSAPRKHADLKPFLKRACELGAHEAKVVTPESVITAAWVRMKCQYGCGGWGSNLCCPPHTPTPDQTRAVLDCYTRGILLHFKGGGPVKEVMPALEREIFLAGYYKAYGFTAGPCWRCEGCNLERCEHPYQARPAMEACGIDVYATARGNGYPIEVVVDHGCDQNHYGLVMVD